MALNQLNLISEDKARAWKVRVINLNTETQTLLQDVGQTLEEVRDDCDSTYVDEIYTYGSQIVSGSREILSGMQKLEGVVDNLLTKIKQLIDSAFDVLRNAKNNSK